MPLFRTTLAASAAAAMVLGGSAIASAQELPEFDSPSLIDATGRGADTKVVYTNGTDHTLTCVVHVGDPEIVNDMLADTVDWPIDDEELVDRIDAAFDAGTLALAMGDVPAGETAEIPLLFPLTDDSFEPIAIGSCSGHGSTYNEVEIDEPAKSGGIFGSLDLFGSLGSGSSFLEADAAR